MSRFLTFLILLALIGCTGAQRTSFVELPMKAQPTKESLTQLSDSVDRLGNEPAADSIDSSLSWLNSQLQNDEPEAYLVSLTQDAFLLGLAAQDPKNSVGLIKDVADDLKLKSSDCRAFGHGRMVPISVQTLKSDGKPDPGWRIRYIWIPSKKLAQPLSAMYFPGPSTPADYQLPPGMYEVFAERMIDGHSKSIEGDRCRSGERNVSNGKWS